MTDIRQRTYEYLSTIGNSNRPFRTDITESSEPYFHPVENGDGDMPNVFDPEKTSRVFGEKLTRINNGRFPSLREQEATTLGKAVAAARSPQQHKQSLIDKINKMRVADQTLAPVKVVKNADPDNPNEVSFGKGNKVEIDPSFAQARKDGPEDGPGSTRTVREGLSLMEKLYIGMERPSKRRQRLREQESSQPGVYGYGKAGDAEMTDAQFSVTGNVVGKYSRMPAETRPEDTAAHKSLRSRDSEEPNKDRGVRTRRVTNEPHSDWEMLAKDGEVGRKASSYDYPLAPGHVAPTGRTRISQDEGGYYPANTPRNVTDGEEEFIDLHSVDVLPDYNGNPDSHFRGLDKDAYGTIGYTKGRDRAEYDQGKADMYKDIDDLLMMRGAGEIEEEEFNQRLIAIVNESEQTKWTNDLTNLFEGK